MRSCNISWYGIPLNNSQRKEGILIWILASVNLTECHGMAISGYPMSGLDDIGKGHGLEAFYYFVKETETGPWSSLFKCFQMVQQWSDASCSGLLVRGPPDCASLEHFNLMGILLSVGVPNSWSILQLGTYKGLVGHFQDFWGLNFDGSFDKAERPVSICWNSGHKRVPAHFVGDVHPQVPSTGDWLQYLAMEYILSLKGALEAVTCIAWHLEGLNSISHVDSHARSRSRSLCKQSLLVFDSTVR